MNKYFKITSLIMIDLAASLAQPLTDLRIIREDQRSVVLEYTPRISNETVIGKHGTNFTKFQFFGCQVSFDSTGRPRFSRTVLMLLPSAEYSIKVTANEFQIIDTVKLIPKPTIKSPDDFGVSESYDEEAYYEIKGSPEQNEIAEIAQVEKTSYGCVGTLILRPIKIMDQERVKIFTHIIVQIEFKKPFPAGTLSTSLIRGDVFQKSRPEGLSKNISRQSVNDSPLAHGEWYRIEVPDQETGMYKLDYNYFQNLNVTINDINSIRLYGNGGAAIPDDPDTSRYPRPKTLQEIPRLIVDKNGNGKLDAQDYVVFYGRGVRRWNYLGGNSFQHVIHPYTEKNYYFFTFNQGTGRGMDTISGAITNPGLTPQSNFQEKIFKEQERYNLLSSGRKWFGKLFYGADNTDVYYNSLPGLMSTLPITYKFVFLRRSSTYDVLNIYENETLLYGPVQMPPTSVTTSDEEAFAVYMSPVNATRNGGVPNNASVVKIQVGSNNPDSKTWLDYYEMFYQRKFEALNDALLFTTSSISGDIRYDVTNFSSDIRAFDITIHDSVKQITQLEINPASPVTCSFQTQQQVGKIKEIAVVGQNGYKIPSAPVKIDNSNIHGVQNAIDLIIISPKEFLTEANRLKSFHESHDSLNTLVVDIEQIYNEFSGGIPDPLAIREFLRYARNNWIIQPRYVLLFGWGHYDSKNSSTNIQSWIPLCETEESLTLIDSYPSDDQFVIMSSSNLPVISIGRLPARSLSDATTMVDKIISYETASTYEPWRNRITFVADDGKTSNGDDGTVYTYDTENLATTKTPKSFEKKKIYIVEYPTVNSAAGRRKPDANKAIVDAINQGSLITNYIGHGNERLWAHEAIFTIEEEIPKLNNKDKLTFVFAATCSYGRFDDFKEVSSAEQLVIMEQGGAIADASAVRATSEYPNIQLNNSFFNSILNRNSNGIYPRLGDAWFTAKSEAMYYDVENIKKFHLFGDPAVRLLSPKSVVTIDSINNKTPDSTITVKALAHVKVDGKIRRYDTTPDTSFNGIGTLQLMDSEKKVSIQDGSYTYQFNVNGSMLYSGEVSINKGRFSATLPIPKDVTFGKNVRISMYSKNDNTDGAGYTENMKIDGIDTTVVVDTVGPAISIFLNDYSFHSGNIVKSNPTLIVKLEDESGINTSTVGIGHKLSAIISNPERTIDLSNYYHSNLDTYKSGEARYQIQDLSNGKYNLSVKAWDIQNNSSVSETFFEVNNTNDLIMMNVLNFPNPFSNSTTFTFQRNSTDLAEVEIRVYTVKGRLINTLKEYTTESAVKIPWDGRDNEGASIANGIYFYKIIIRSQNNQGSCETIGKMAVIR